LKPAHPVPSTTTRGDFVVVVVVDDELFVSVVVSFPIVVVVIDKDCDRNTDERCRASVLPVHHHDCINGWRQLPELLVAVFTLSNERNIIAYNYMHVLVYIILHVIY
jgi:hypothetical protein